MNFFARAHYGAILKMKKHSTNPFFQGNVFKFAQKKILLENPHKIKFNFEIYFISWQFETSIKCGLKMLRFSYNPTLYFNKSCYHTNERKQEQ